MRTVLLAFFLFTAEETLAESGDGRQGEAIKMVNGFPVVHTFINGRGPFRILIDTGAARCAVRRSVALRAGLIPKRQIALATTVSEKFVSVAVAAVRVVSIEAPETEILINDLPSLDGLESHVDGLVGQSFLAQRPYLINFRARRLWLGDEAVVKAQHFGPPMDVELSFGRPHLLVGVEPQRPPSRLILDSGVKKLGPPVRRRRHEPRWACATTHPESHIECRRP